MTIYQVDELHHTHTCPSDPQPHPFSIQRRIVAVTPGRNCLTPLTVRCGDRRVTLPCPRREPYDRQCASCRTVITVRRVTTHHLGAEQHPHGTVPSGLADHPCALCHRPLAAVLAHVGAHVVCVKDYARAHERETA